MVVFRGWNYKISNDLVKLAAKKKIKANLIACELRVNFLLYFAKLQICSSIKYKNTFFFANYFLKCNKVERNLISFNCFSKYSYISQVHNHQKLNIYHLAHARFFLFFLFFIFLQQKSK